MYKILLVDDERFEYELWQELLDGDTFKITWKFNIKDAFLEFTKNRNSFDLIIMDACVPYKGEPNTVRLIQRIIKDGFKKPIVACSSNSTYIKKLIEAGATHSVLKDDISMKKKDKVRETILKILLQT